MRRTYFLGRIFQTDIEAGIDFLFMLAYVLFMMRGTVGEGAMIAFTFIVSILIHEFGHVFAVKRLLAMPCRVILWAFGGLCVYPRLGGGTNPRAQLLISLAGPAFGLVLAGIAWLILRFAPLESEIAYGWVSFFFLFNLVVNLANLLPIYPLDGGQALLAVLTPSRGAGRAMAAVRKVSIAVGVVATMAAFHFGYRIAAILAILLVMQNLMGAGTPRG